ncbi:hypothetical protein [Metapseudomonas otitidis]|uniref:hypothetical protein n=1 Tax=Metapseudomonas otitidis TaxID=319939 RepID=UPI0013E09F4D|nr:hypothetical protein [Pseudomonas otitidis]
MEGEEVRGVVDALHRHHHTDDMHAGEGGLRDIGPVQFYPGGAAHQRAGGVEGEVGHAQSPFKRDAAEHIHNAGLIFLAGSPNPSSSWQVPSVFVGFDAAL